MQDSRGFRPKTTPEAQNLQLQFWVRTPRFSRENARKVETPGRYPDALCAKPRALHRCKCKIPAVSAQKRPPRRKICMAGAEKSGGRKRKFRNVELPVGNRTQVAENHPESPQQNLDKNLKTLGKRSKTRTPKGRRRRLEWTPKSFM